jgi:hypothetical protein
MYSLTVLRYGTTTCKLSEPIGDLGIQYWRATTASATRPCASYSPHGFRLGSTRVRVVSDRGTPPRTTQHHLHTGRYGPTLHKHSGIFRFGMGVHYKADGS